MHLASGYTSCSGSLGYSVVGLLVVLNVLGSTGFRDANWNKPKDKSEFKVWRGKAEIDYYDMVEIGNWIYELGDRLPDALRYYWVDNEVYYPFGAMVRSMFAIFQFHYGPQGFTPSFVLGMETIVHYVLLKSNFIIARHGGVRGNGKDSTILRAGIRPLQICYVGLTSSNFTEKVYPMLRRKRNIHLHAHKKSRPHRSRRRRVRDVQNTTTEQVAGMQNSTTSDAGNPGIESPSELTHKSLSVTNQSALPDESALPEDDEKVLMPSGPRGRLMYTISHGGKGNHRQTIVDVPDPDDNRLENIAVSMFWLIYEIIPHTCQFPATEKALFQKAFEGVLGLVISLYLYDKDDYVEEYERIFKMPAKRFEAEWVRLEGIARGIQKTTKISIRRPYSIDV